MDSTLLEAKLKDRYDGITEFVVKDGRRIEAKITASDKRPEHERFLIQMNGCAFYRATGRDAAEFVRKTVEDRQCAFDVNPSVSIRGLECFGA
jgi:hypothetical protein